jgi:serine/threonine protein kinase
MYVFADIVHRDLKLQNILVGSNADDPTDQLFIKVTYIASHCLNVSS